MPEYHLLYFPAGATDWSRIPLAGQSFSIGRTAENDLALNDDQVSRQHAALFFDARGAWLMDKNSSNGVLINGQRIQPGGWVPLAPGVNFTIGSTTLCLQAVTAAPVGYPAAAQPRLAPQNAAPKPKRSRLATPLVIVLLVLACLALTGGGIAAYYFLPGLLSKPSTLPSATQQASKQTAAPTQASKAVVAPPTVVDTLSGTPGGDPIKDDHGVSLNVAANTVDNGQSVTLERATLSQGMQQEMEKAYTIDSMAYAARLPAGEDGAGRADLALPATSPNSQLAVLVDNQFIGILDTPAQNGVFHINPSLAASSTDKVFSDPASGTAPAPNRYLVVTPKTSTLYLPGTGRLSLQNSPPPPIARNPETVPVRLAAGGIFWFMNLNQKSMGSMFFPAAVQDETYGKSCVAEVLTLSHCWRNPESTVYIFWKDDYPADLKDTQFTVAINTIQAVAKIMSTYAQKGFTGAAISSSNPVYVVVEAGAKEPYYSAKIGNLYIPWDIIGTINDVKNTCTISHELFHWVEGVHYYMIAAALSNPKSWWLEMSAENGSFLMDPACIDKNLTQYGLVNTSANVLGFQAAPFMWESNEQARYIQAQQLYISICSGGSGCALTQDAWAAAINGGNYPMEGTAQTAYEQNAKDLGLYLLGAAPASSRTDASIPPAAGTGSGFGDYIILKASDSNDFEYGLSMNQFNAVNDQQVKITAPIAKGSVYPLWVGNGTGTPMGASKSIAGLPGLLTIQPGPGFWIKKDNDAPVFYDAGKGLVMGPISNKLGVGKVRIVAVAPTSDQTFNAVMSLVDLSGDWTGKFGNLAITPVDCKDYSQGSQTNHDDTFLQALSGNGVFKENSTTSDDIDLNWDGTPPKGETATADVTVGTDKVVLNYTVTIPKPDNSGGLLRQWLGGNHTTASLPQAQRRIAWFSTAPLLPVLGAAAWLRRQKRKWARWSWLVLALGAIVLFAILLSSCTGIAIWGTIDATYTFKTIEYVGPQEPAAAGAPPSTQGVTWNLSNGQVEVDLNLQEEVSVTGDNGADTTQVQPCNLKATGSATGTIGPDGSVTAPSNN